MCWILLIAVCPGICLAILAQSMKVTGNMSLPLYLDYRFACYSVVFEALVLYWEIHDNCSMVMWRRGVMVSMQVSINEVALHRARLLLGWATVWIHVNHFGMQPTTYVNSAFHPSKVGKSGVTLSGWGWGWVCSLTSGGRNPVWSHMANVL